MVPSSFQEQSTTTTTVANAHGPWKRCAEVAAEAVTAQEHLLREKIAL